MRAIRFGSAGIRCAIGAALSAYALVGLFAMTGHAGQARPVSAGVYSAAQATRGAQLYTDTCRSCHGKDLEGVEGPTLTGPEFLASWAGLPVSDLVDKIQNTMPQDNPGTLSRPQATDIAAYVLQAGKFPAGQAELSAATLPQVMFPGTKAAPRAAAAGGAGLALTPVANLAQFMRGVTFPNANIIFNTQLYDPGKTKPKMPTPYDYVLWGGTVYYGWQAVDQAVLALKETTPLFLLPGRKCQNGRPVPVQNADFQQYTHDLVTFTDELWKAVQSRKQETVSDLSEKLNDTCANCHKVYRDVSVSGTASEGSLTADRCNAMPKGGGRAQ
jgi:S-disulfanyl-L-cysteine oxidoreductase SoxD